MKIFIADTDNRDIVSLIYHYNVLGHEPCVPSPKTPGSQFSPLWPRFLFKDRVTGLRHINVADDLFAISGFGEDRFVTQEWLKQNSIYDAPIFLSFIDVTQDGHTIDAWHSTPNAKVTLQEFKSIASKYFPHAKWINSSLNHFDHDMMGCRNIVRWLPANYDEVGDSVNHCNMYRHSFEFEFLNVSTQRIETDTYGFTSFNHNFSIRHPVEYALFCAVNAKLESIGRRDLIITNYGGNIRRHGADIAFSDERGKTGTFKTLTPQEAMQRYVSSRCVVHLKQFDWAGGVPAGCRISGTPMIIQKKYVNMTHANNVLVNGHNCMFAYDVDDIVDCMLKIDTDVAFRTRLSNNARALNDELFDESYWNSWRMFLSRLQ